MELTFVSPFFPNVVKDRHSISLSLFVLSIVNNALCVDVHSFAVKNTLAEVAAVRAFAFPR
jgi:hypothetical protein